MGKADNLNFGTKVNYYEGVIVGIEDGIISVDVLGRLGFFEIPESSVIAEAPLQVGQMLGWKMSFFEQLRADAAADYEPGVRNSDNTFYMEGTVSYVEDCAVALEAKCGLGSFKSPKRMLLSDIEFESGQTVGWNTSKFVQLGSEVNEKYISNLHNRERRALEISGNNI